MNGLARLRPTRRTIFVIIGFLWAISFGALRDFVWADLREGLIDLRGMSRPARVLTWTGFGLLALVLAGLLFNDFWRATSPLLPLTTVVPGRGQMLPIALLPATLFLLSISWAFLLAGALHSHPLVRLGVVLVFLPAAGLWLSDSLASLSLTGITPAIVAGGLAIVLVPIFFLLRLRRPARPAAEFLVLLVLAALVFVPTQIDDIEQWQQLGSPMMVAKIEGTLTFLSALVMPLLFLVGLDIAGFARQASFWTVQIVTARFPRWLELITLAGLLFALVRRSIIEIATRIADNGVGSTLISYAGALGAIGAVGLAWLLVTRGRTERAPTADKATEGAEETGLPLILAVLGPQLVSSAGLWVSLGLLPLMALVGALSDVMGRLGTQATEPWGYVVDVLAVTAAVVLARRGRQGAALYLAAFGFLDLWITLTNPGHVLEALYWDSSALVEFWLVVGVGVFALAAVLRRQLTNERIAAVLFAGMLIWLMRQTDFISSPFSPLFGAAGLGFLVFGLAWDALTAGAWANTETRGLPRTSRILLYVGYVLLSVTAVNWAVTAHNLSAANQLTGDLAFVGLVRFGRPMLYAVLFAALAKPAALFQSMSPAEETHELS